MLAMDTLTDWLSKAINRRIHIRFTYAGMVREVNPHRLGQLHNGNLCLLAYQIGGMSSSISEPAWRLYSLSKIESLELSDLSFEVRHDYTVDDIRFHSIITQC